MGPVPLTPGVAFLLVPGAKPLIKGESLFADVALDVATEAFSDVVVDGFKHILRRKRLVGPRKGRVISPVASEFLWADACPIWVGKLSNRNHTQPYADPVNLVEFAVTHPLLLAHSAEDLHEGLVV